MGIVDKLDDALANDLTGGLSAGIEAPAPKHAYYSDKPLAFSEKCNLLP